MKTRSGPSSVAITGPDPISADQSTDTDRRIALLIDGFESGRPMQRD